MQIIDSHTHIDFEEFKLDRNQAIQRAVESGVNKIIISSTVEDRWKYIHKVCSENNKHCYAAYGLHPMFMDEHNLSKQNNDLDKLTMWIKIHKTVAIGEIGLDYYIQEADDKHRKAQIELFNSQLEIAAQFNLPIIIHARKSLDIILKHLRLFPSLRGSIHSFSGSEQQAKQLIDLGFYLSFGGPVTYNRATRLQKIIKSIPLEAMLVETDSPDQADSNHHLQRNEPAFIFEVVKKIAQLKNVEKEHIAEITTKNAMSLFKLGND